MVPPTLLTSTSMRPKRAVAAAAVESDGEAVGFVAQALHNLLESDEGDDP